MTQLEKVYLTVTDSIVKGVNQLTAAVVREEPKLEIWNSTESLSLEANQRSSRFPSYTEMIATILLSDASTAKALQDIYMLMERKYPFLEQRGHSWKNSVRHTLSFNECFLKIPREDSGQRCNWTIHPKYMRRFLLGNFKTSRVLSRRRKGMEKEMEECPKAKLSNASLLHLHNNQMNGMQQYHFQSMNDFHCSYSVFQEQERADIQQHPTTTTTSSHQNRLRHYPLYNPTNHNAYNWPMKHDFSCNQESYDDNFRLYYDFSKFCIKLLNEEITGYW